MPALIRLHCSFKPANEQLQLGVAASALAQLDDELDQLLANWQQTLLDNLEDPTIQANLELLKVSARELTESFITSCISWRTSHPVSCQGTGSPVRAGKDHRQQR